MAYLSLKDYKRFRDGIEAQYDNLLKERELQLKKIVEDNKKTYDKICSKWAEYSMLCDVYTTASQKAEDISDEIEKLLQEYDKEDNQTEIEELKTEIEWLKSKIEK